jgi:hypothetical protein
VPKVTSFQLAGLDLWFYSNDHVPEHFHAEKPGEWGVRVFFLRDPGEMIEVMYSTKPRRPSKADLKVLKASAEQHRVGLLEEWEAKVLVTGAGTER